MGWTDLHDAAYYGDLERTKKLLKKGKNPNVKDKYGRTPLHIAASEGHVDIVKLLLEHGADPNIQNKNGRTPLHWAASKGRDDVVKLLLEHGADPNAQDKDGETPLHKAAYWGHLYVVRLLLEHGADPNAQDKDGKTPLHDAASGGGVRDGIVDPKLEILSVLESGVDPNTIDFFGEMPLYVAASKERVDVVRLLLEHGADPNARDNANRTPLHWATGHVDIVKLLLEHGADPNIQNKDGETPLHDAAYWGHLDDVKLLLEHGADPNIQNKDGHTPLHWAASKGRDDHGADPNIQNKDGHTPLHAAAYNGHVEVVKLLLGYKADPNAKDKDSRAPLHWAALNGHVEVVKLLLEHRADPNIQNKDGVAPLHLAAYEGRVDVVKLLLGYKADPNAKDKDGDTPLHLAAYKGHVEVVKLLLEYGADPTVKNKDGSTPLDLARAEGRREVVSVIEEWVRRGEKPPQRQRAAETRPWGGSQKAVSLQVSTAQSPPVQSLPSHGVLVVLSPLLADVELVERLSGEAVRYVPVSFSGSFFNVPELGLSSCVFFRCGAYFCIYRCVLNGVQVAVKMPVQYRADFERGAPPHLTQAPPAVLKELETVKALSHRNVLRLAAAWPGYGVLAYEWGDGGSLRDQKLSSGDVLKALVHVAWGLRYLHSRGVVHGDLKPENVIVVGGVCKIADLASVKRLLSRISGSRVGVCTSGFCAPEQIDVRLGAEARVKGFEDRIDVYQLANLALDLIGAETIDGAEWSPDKVEKAAREAEAVGLSDFVRQALELEPWRRPNAEEAAKRIAAEWRKRELP
jgi:ankyrin repeat protein